MHPIVKEMVNLNEEKVMWLVRRALNDHINPVEVLEYLNDGVQKVGTLFEKGEYSISDLMMAGIIYEEVMQFEEITFENEIHKMKVNKTVVIGTIFDDLHDIGKSIFKNALLTAGFNIVDLGVDVKPEKFIDEVQKYEFAILGISVIMSDSLPYVEKTIKLLEKSGLRSRIKVILGGVAITEEICRTYGADGYSRDVLNGIRLCKEWVAENE